MPSRLSAHPSQNYISPRASEHVIFLQAMLEGIVTVEAQCCCSIEARGTNQASSSQPGKGTKTQVGLLCTKLRLDRKFILPSILKLKSDVQLWHVNNLPFWHFNE